MMTKPKVYIFSGLGADHRAFQNLDFSKVDAVFIPWITPLKNESLTDYAKRISSQINETDVVYIGLSFGGIVAAEVAKIKAPGQLILIASVTNYQEIPRRYRIAGKLRLHKLIPAKWMLHANFLTNWFFGVQTAADKKMLKDILHDTDPVFLKWAIHQILFWKNTTRFANTKHIHGTKDRILPFRKVKPDVAIQNGGHLMTLNCAGDIQPVLDGLLSCP